MGGPQTLIRTYRGRQQADANRAFEVDAQTLGAEGYLPTTQSWAAGQWGCGAWLLALLLCVLLIGILVFVYMLIVKPEGTLTVTYVRQTQPSVDDMMPCPRCAETIKRAAQVCRFCGLMLTPGD